MKNLFFFISFFLPIGVFCQPKNKCNYLNFVFIIDGKIERVHEGVIVLNDSLVSDSIICFTNYYVGTINFSNGDFEKFLSIPVDREILIRFKWSRPWPNYKEYVYEERLAAKWLNHGYMIMNIYNFDNKKNWKDFDQRTGYGIEWQASERSKIISRKPRRK